MRLLAEILENVKESNQKPSFFKKELRAILKKERLVQKNLAHPLCWGPLQQRRSFAALSQEKIFGHDEKNLVIASYSPIQSELNLMSYSNSSWIFPRVHNEKLLWFFKKKDDELERSQFGILEAPLSACFEIQEIKTPLVMFVPCLAASQKGHRLGYGGGFYDRLLKTNPNILTIACVYSQFYFDVLPHESFDETVDCIATEEEFIFVKPQTQVLCKLRT